MPKRKLKIAIFHLAFFYSGGGEKLVLKEIEELARRGHQVDCYTPILDKKLCFPDLIGKYNIITLFPNTPRFIQKNETAKLLFTCILFPFIAGRFKAYDVILGANQPGPWFSWIIKKLYKVPYVIYIAQPTRIIYPRKVDLDNGIWVKTASNHLPLLVKFAKPFFVWADRISIRQSDAVLVNGRYMSKIIKRVYQTPTVVCPAGATTSTQVVKNKWKGTVSVDGFKIPKPYLLITNRHFPQKRFEYALKALPPILKHFPSLRLIITGNPTVYTTRLKKYAKQLKIAERVIFTGYIKEKDLSNLYRHAALYLYTPPEEDFGMGVIEAMGNGTPVVAWNHAGPAYTVEHNRTGYLVPADDDQAYTTAIIKLIKNKRLNMQMAKRGIEHVNKNYTYNKHFDILEDELFKVSKK